MSPKGTNEGGRDSDIEGAHAFENLAITGS